MKATELLTGAKELLYRGTELYTGVQIVIPATIISEQSFTAFYNKLVKRPGDPPAQTFLLGFDSQPIYAEKALYDLAMWSREQPALADALRQTPAEKIADLLATEQPPNGVADEIWQSWRSRVHSYLEQYGHTIYNMDFVNPVPADAPAPIFEILRFYLQGQGTNPYKRQQEAVLKREQATQAIIARLDPVRASLFKKLLAWAQGIGPVREDALSGIGLGWPLLRQLLLELGRRLVSAGAIAQANDVFWLEKLEVEQAAAALDGGQTHLDSFATLVDERKMEWRGRKRVTPPQVLPENTLWSKLGLDQFMPAVSTEQSGPVIKGIPVGNGKVTATARVLHGPEDFSTMQAGDILVAGITTPAWTPLFVLASGVVTDVGGPMSHSSIVAREYGIPAVLGTGVATKRIHSGQQIRVDGDAGTVTLLDEVAEAPSEVTGAAPQSRINQVKWIAAAAGLIATLIIWRRRRRKRT
jgi:pyruvate,water dikinase